MDELLKKANELGLMIKGTEIYVRFEELSLKIERDNEARNLLEEYAAAAQAFQEKEDSGAAIEVDEKKEFQELSEKISGNQLIREYMATNTYYVNLMMQIQKAISEPEGEPISETKIIKPGHTGKIITGV